MNGVFTFNVGDLIAGVTRSNQWEWHGPCKAEIEADHVDAELYVEPLSECDIVTPHVVSNFDKEPAALELQQELSTAQADGSADAMLLVNHPDFGGVYSVTIGLRPQKYELFRTFVMLHFGRRDLNGRIMCSFAGFAHPSTTRAIIPTKNEFLLGRPYLVLGDSRLVFSAKPLP